MSEFGGLWQHTHTQHAPQRQNNQLNDCGHSMDFYGEKKISMYNILCILIGDSYQIRPLSSHLYI